MSQLTLPTVEHEEAQLRGNVLLLPTFIQNYPPSCNTAIPPST